MSPTIIPVGSDLLDDERPIMEISTGGMTWKVGANGVEKIVPYIEPFAGGMLYYGIWKNGQLLLRLNGNHVSYVMHKITLRGGNGHGKP